MTAFDQDHPPSAELVNECVHCGFCLPTCPTYVLWGEEMDSPRGRIYLMKQALEGGPLDAASVRHFDRCLGCMACVTACPSGVSYDKLIEATRYQVERRSPRSIAERALRGAIFSLFPYPRRLALLRRPLRAYQRSRLGTWLTGSSLLRRLPPSLAAMEALLPRFGTDSAATAGRSPALGSRRLTVGMLTGCVQRVFFPEVNAATVRVLTAEGCEVIAPRDQGCCGALSLHMGRRQEAQRFARRLLDSFDRARVGTVVVNAAGCGSAMKEYGELLADDPVYAARAARFSARVRDVTELLSELGPVAPRHPLEVKVAYHDACHLAHAQGVRRQPRELLSQVPGLELVEIPEAEICCGSAGVYNVLNPGPASELGARKAANVASTGAQVLVTANPGCLLQISAALGPDDAGMPLLHTVQVLDASIRGDASVVLPGHHPGRRASRH